MCPCPVGIGLSQNIVQYIRLLQIPGSIDNVVYRTDDIVIKEPWELDIVPGSTGMHNPLYTRPVPAIANGGMQCITCSEICSWDHKLLSGIIAYITILGIHSPMDTVNGQHHIINWSQSNFIRNRIGRDGLQEIFLTWAQAQCYRED